MSLKEYMEARFKDAERAIAKAEDAMEKRFANTNEWRMTVESLQRGYLPRSEFDQAIASLNGKVEAVQRNMWIGIGLLLALQFFAGIALMVWHSIR